MAVSSNTLIHFTSQFETVVKILESNGFWPKYCIEFGWQDKRTKDFVDFAVPECCFCDIPFSKISQHMSLYGSYGIGLSKEWGKEKGLSPVLYVVRKSHLAKIIKEFRKQAKIDGVNLKILAFLKQYIGVNYRYDEKIKGWERISDNYNYYNEREWRYVPEVLDVSQMVVKVEDREKFDSNALSKNTLKFMLNFSADDVKYIIVNNINERIQLVEKIKLMSHYTESEKLKLCSCILTNDFIKEDI